MRYKVKTVNEEQLHQVEALVEGKTCVYGTSTLFRFVATGDLSEELQDRLRAIGARIVPEQAYDLDGSPAA